jgi:serine/threonine protein kinase
LRHPNIVQFLGIHISSSDEHYIVTEYLSKGSLLDLLTASTKIDTLDLVTMFENSNMYFTIFLHRSKDAAAGMKYLSSQNIVHRDLAARNLLVSSGTIEGNKYLAKVSGERTLQSSSELCRFWDGQNTWC